MIKTKGEMTFSTIAVAALVLAVLVVLFIMFTKGSGIFSKTVNSCQNGGGRCVSSSTGCERTLDLKCDKNQVCCLETGS